MLKGDVKDKLIVKCSTVPDVTAVTAKAIGVHGGRFKPTLCSVRRRWLREASRLANLRDRKRKSRKLIPYCKGVMGRVNIDFGGQPAETAALLKVIGNTLILSMIETISEGYVVAEKTGLGVDALRQFFEMMFPGPYVAYSTRMKSGDHYRREEPLFAVDLASASNRPAGLNDLVIHLPD
jgi:hypothetical protein